MDPSIGKAKPPTGLELVDGRPPLSSYVHTILCVLSKGMEVTEKIMHFSISSNLVQYLSLVMKESLTESIKNTNNWAGVTAVMPFFGGFIADTYLGHPLAISIFSMFYILGMIIVTLSTSLDSLKPPCLKHKSQACGVPTSFQAGFFFLGLYLVSMGGGGVKPSLQALGADQFDEEHIEEKKWKSSFFNWWNFGAYIGMTLGITVMVYIETNVGWNVGFSISTTLISVGTLIFFVGLPLYRRKAINESPFTSILQVLVASLLKHNVQVPSNENLLYEVHMDSLLITRRQLQHSRKFRFLDKAATPTSSDLLGSNEGIINSSNVNPWRLCTVTQVEEVKLLLEVLPIWLTSLMFGVVIVQLSTLFTKQGAAMNTQIGATGFHIPAASFHVVSVATTVLLLPIYDLLLVPTTRAMTGHERGITLLQRMGIGLFFSIVGMAVAAVIERRRLRVAIEGEPTLSIFWLLPQYFIIGFGDVFVYVGQQEFFYDQMPDAMRSLGVALSLGTIGFANFLSTFLIIIVEHVTNLHGSKSWFGPNINSSHFDYYYWLLVVLGLINFLTFLMLAHFYCYKKPKSVYLNANDA